jgi:hypothetical protein
MGVFVLDQQHQPLMPCSEKRARLLLARKRAVVHHGRVAVRASGSFRVGSVDGINARYCRLVQRADGYEMGLVPPPSRHQKEDLLPPHA